MSSARSLPTKMAALLRNSVVFALVALAFVASRPALAEDFASRCVDNYKVVDLQLPIKIDLVAVCRCQAGVLKKKGYDTDNFFSNMEGQFSRLVIKPGELKPDDQIMREVMAKYTRSIQDSSAAFMECAQKDIKAAVDADFKRQKAASQNGAGGQGGRK